MTWKHTRLRRPVAIILGALALVSLTTTEASADRRTFGYSYSYMTLPAESLELEHYLDAAFAPADDPTTDEIEDALEVGWRHQLEVEYAITDHLDFGLYNVFQQKAFSAFEYKGLKLRSRYRIGERDDFVVDPAIYGEVIYYGDEVKLEQILILGKVVGDFQFSFNGKVEEEFELESDAFTFVMVPSVGAAYHVSQRLSLGLEYLGKVAIFEGELGDMGHFVGPTVSVAGKGFWWTVAGQLQVSDFEGFADYQVRSIFALLL